MTNNNILLVEDDVNLGYLLRENLAAKGFNVTLAETGEAGLEAAMKEDFDICVFDIMLPKLDGFSLAQQFKQKHPDKPFIFLTARALEKDRLKGFEIGADDFVAKPFNFKELYYRITAILRRTNKRHAGEVQVAEKIYIGNFEFYPDQRLIRIADDEKKLSQREAGLLEVLLNNRGTYITRSEILKAVWGNDDYFTSKSMDVYITRVRKILKQDPAIEIENLYGTGYRIRYNQPV